MCHLIHTQWKRKALKDAADNKSQITAVFAGTLTGNFLPSQLIYKGTTKHCLPTVKFPSDCHITCSDNHWSNESTMISYLNILFPYIDCKREELKLALVIFELKEWKKC